MNKKDSKRIDYIAPQVIDLGISPVLSGQDEGCVPGQSFPGSCHPGFRAATMCETGTFAGKNCKVGDNQL